jgi:L-fucose isomerase-like protein
LKKDKIMMQNQKIKIGFIPAHLEEFDDQWAETMRERCITSFQKFDLVEFITPGKDLVKQGLVKNEEDSKKVAEFFKRKEIDAIIIGTMTFSDELSIYSIIEQFTDLPIMLFGTKEKLIEDASFLSQSFCGTLSISSGFKRRNINFYFGGIHNPEDKVFSENLQNFFRISQSLLSFYKARIGMVGLRPASFEACVSNEELLIDKFKQRIIPINLIDIEHSILDIADQEASIKNIIEELRINYDCSLIQESNLIRLSKLEIILKQLIKANELNCLTIQCWNSIQKYLKITPCLTVSRITDQGIPVACEGDVYGVLTMLIQYHSTLGKQPPFFADWLMKHEDKKNTFLAWHCGNCPSFLASGTKKAAIRCLCPFEKEFGKSSEESMAGVELQLRPGLVTINSIVEHRGIFKMLSTTGMVHEGPEKIRGSWGWIEVNDLEYLYENLIHYGFNHHMSIINGNQSEIIKEFCRISGIELIKI